MNNEQFRRLLLGEQSSKDGNAAAPTASPAATPSIALGSRKRASFPMTPRSVRGARSNTSEFARQLAERNAKSKPNKSFKSSAPKGSKLAAGYHDRTKERVDDEVDERAQRIKALEESLKLGQIDRATFDKTVEEIAGGDISGTHLVRGLDRKLLERVRRGEDVLNGTSKAEDKSESPPKDIENELDELEERDIVPIVREKAEKKGEMAPPPPVAGVKRSRNEILAELKAARKAAAEAAAAEHAAKYPALGPGFRRIGDMKEGSRIEIDERGREVLIIRDAEGNEKRKVRKQKSEEKAEEKPQILERDYDILRPAPAPAPLEEEDDDDDIFEGVGSNYNPLAELQGADGEDSSSSEEEDDDEPAQAAKKPRTDSISKDNTTSIAPAGSTTTSPSSETEPKSSAPGPRRNYFTVAPSASDIAAQSTGHETVLAALKKVRTMDPDSALLQNDEETRLKKRAVQLAASDRDLEDIDMGFGSSRFDDAEEMEEGKRVKLAEWKGLGDDEDAEGHRERGGKQRKRGSKKKKADKNNPAEVLKAMERQKKGNTLG